MSSAAMPTRRRFLGRALALALAGLAWPLTGRAGKAGGGNDPSGPCHDLVDEGTDFVDGFHWSTRAAGDEGLLFAGTGAVYESAALCSQQPFTHASLQWEAVPADATVWFSARAAQDGALWGPWQSLSPDSHPGPTGGHVTGLTHTGPTTRLQYRAEAAGGTALRRVAVAVFDSGRRPERTRAAAATTGPLHRIAVAGVARDGALVTGGGNVHDLSSGRAISVVPREEWGADESYRFREDGTESWREMFVPPKLLVVHHTATRNTYDSRDEAAGEVRVIYDYHARTLRWGDIAYHAIIDRFGNIFEGRHGRGGDPADGPHPREVLSQAVTGGHTTNYEYGTIGVALLGDATQPSWEMTGAAGPMWEALVRYCTFESARAGIQPLAFAGSEAVPAVADFLRSDDVWHDGAQQVCPHRELQQTTCPGDVVIGLLPALRAAVHEGLAGLSRAGTSLGIVSPNARELPPGAPVRLSPGVDAPEDPWVAAGLEYAVEGWFKPAASEDLDYLSGYTGGEQPGLEWRALTPGGEIDFTPFEPGHYTVHARAVLRQDDGSGRSAWWAKNTFLVRESVAEDVGN